MFEEQEVSDKIFPGYIPCFKTRMKHEMREKREDINEF